MARIRSIKPELRTSITVSAWPREVRYFFVLLWGYLDDYGRGVDDEMLIAADCFPRDRDITPEIVDEWLELIADSGPLCRYEVDGRRYLHAVNWSEHQKPAHPTRSKVPPCPDDEPDAHKEWREKHPQRVVKRSRKSHENLAKISPDPASASGEGSGEAPRAARPKSEADRPADDEPEPPAPTEESGSAAQDADGTPREILANSSREAHEEFAPEQGSKGAREQGAREREDARARETTSPPSTEAPLASLAPPPVPASLVIDRDSLAAHIADELSVRTGLDVTPAHCTWVAEDMLTRMPPRHDPVLWVRGQIRVAEDIRQFLTPDLAAAYTARARRPAVVADEPGRSRKAVPLPDDFKVTDAMRRWANREAPAGIDLDHETAQFISHYRARGTKCVSWPDEWQKWVRGARPRKAPAAMAVGHQPYRNPVDQSVYYEDL